MTCRNHSDNHCWVLITARGFFRRHQIGLYFCDDLPAFLRGVGEDSTATLIYFRCFATMMDGLGHLTILRTLSTQELNGIIRQMNPDTKDVSAELIEQIGEKRICYNNNTLPFETKREEKTPDETNN